MLCPRLSELDILFDLVVEVIHGVHRVSHPIIPKPIWTQGFIPQVRVPEAPKCMVPRFMRSGVRIHKFQFLQCRVEVAPDNIRGWALADDFRTFPLQSA
jgi:hypothetical protein